MKKIVEVAVILSAVNKMGAVINQAVNSAEHRMATFATRAAMYGDKAMSWGKNAMLTGALIAAPLLLSINAAEESAVAFSRLDRIYKQMGETTGQVAREQSEFASAYQFKIGIEDEQIMLAQAKLATFANVMKKEARDAGVMTRATKLAFDLQAAGFGEGTGNAVQLGKALNDPIKGINALRRNGISFTKSEQDKIKALTESGRLLEAQNIILSAVETQVGGVAEETVTSSAKMKIAWGEIQEQIGGALLPVIMDLSTYVTGTLLPGFMDWKKDNEGLFNLLVKGAAIVAALAVTFGVFGWIFGAVMNGVSAAIQVIQLLGNVTKIGTAIQWAWNAAAAANPYVLIAIAIIALIALVVLLIVYFEEIWGWFQRQSDAVKVLIVVVLALVAPFLLVVAAIMWVYTNWDLVVKFFNDTINAIGKWFSGLWDSMMANLMAVINFYLSIPNMIYGVWLRIAAFLGGLWDTMVANFMEVVDFYLSIPGQIYGVWLGMLGFFGGLWDGVKNIFSGFVDYIMGLPSLMLEAGMNIMNSLWEGIKSTVNKPIDAVANVAQQIRDYFPFSPAKEGALRDIHRVKLMETVAQSVRPGALIHKVDESTQAVASRLPVLPQPVYGPGASGGLSMSGSVSGQPVTLNFSPTINITGTGTGGAVTPDDIMAALRNSGNDLLRYIKQLFTDEERKKY